MRVTLISTLLLVSFSLFAQGEYLWTKKITQSTYNTAPVSYDATVDDDGVMYVTADYSGTVYDTSSALSTPYSEYNTLISKIDRFGEIEWARQISGPEDDLSYKISYDNNKDVYVTGSFSDSLILDTTFLAEANSYNEQMYVLKLDQDGNLIWFYTPSYSFGSSKALDIEIDDLGNCFVVGRFTSTIELAMDTLTNQTGFNHESGVIFKLNSNGIVDWQQQLKGLTSTSFTDISKAGNGMYFFGGTYKGFGEFTDSTFATVSGHWQHQDAIIGKIDDQGSFVWRYNFGNVNSSLSDAYATIQNLETNDFGELCFTGVFGGGNTGAVLNIDTFSFNQGYNGDMIFSKFTTNGELIWASHNQGGNWTNVAYDLDLTRGGDYYISAKMSQTNVFADTVVSNIPYPYRCILKISGVDGSFMSYENIYPHHVYNFGFAPKFSFDAYGNRYSFGKGTTNTSNTANMGHYVIKKSSGDMVFSGTVFYDDNENMSMDSLEFTVPYIIIEGDSGEFYKTSDLSGQFSVSLDSSDHTFEVNPPLYWYYTHPLPDGVQYTFPPYATDSVTDVDFGLKMHPGITDVKIEMGSSQFVPGFDGYFRLAYKNIGTETSYYGTVTFTYPDSLTYDSYTSSIDTLLSHVGNTMVWQYDSLNVGQEKTINIYFDVPANVNLLGDTLIAYSSISQSLIDSNLLNNTDTLREIVVGSFDPNYKANTPAGYLEQGYITTSDSIFEYEIHFQNTGTASAVNVVLVDSLPLEIDVTSFEVLVASHDYTYDISGPGVLTFTFANINLPDSNTNLLESQGFVKFRVKTRNDLEPDTSIHNTAYIYFDFNPPIVTNTKINTIYSCEELALTIPNTTLCYGEQLIAYCPEGNMNDYTWQIDSFYISTLDSLDWLSDTAGTFNLTLQSNNRLCSKDTTMSITILPSVPMSSFNIHLCQGDSVLLSGSYQNSNGVYYDSLQTIQGCDSILATTLIINPIYLFNEDITICQGDSALIYGNYENVAGVYYDSLQTVHGCDSVLSTNLTVNPSFYINEDITICQGDSALIYGNYENVAGVYYDSLQTVHGCDSVLSTSLAVNPSVYFNQDVSICQGDSVLVYGEYQSAAGIYYDSLIAANGCDLILATTLTVMPSYFFMQDVSICSGDSVLLYGSYENSAGIYYDSLQTVFGCDSVFATTLDVVSHPVINQSVSICEGDSALIYGSYQNLAGTYYDSLQSSAGCDSIVSTTLSLISLPNVVLEDFSQDTICLDAPSEILPLGLPAGGTYFGNGVNGGSFVATDAGIGTHEIVYTYTDGNSCVSMDTTYVSVDLCTGIQRISAETKIMVYPNPSNGLFTIEKPKDVDRLVKLAVYDVSGRLLIEEEIPGMATKTMINLGKYSLGVYYLQVSIEDEMFFMPIIKY